MITGLRGTSLCLPGGQGKNATVLTRKLAAKADVFNRKQWKPGPIQLRADLPSRLKAVPQASVWRSSERQLVVLSSLTPRRFGVGVLSGKISVWT